MAKSYMKYNGQENVLEIHIENDTEFAMLLGCVWAYSFYVTSGQNCKEKWQDFENLLTDNSADYCKTAIEMYNWPEQFWGDSEKTLYKENGSIFWKKFFLSEQYEEYSAANIVFEIVVNESGYPEFKEMKVGYSVAACILFLGVTGLFTANMLDFSMDKYALDKYKTVAETNVELLETARYWLINDSITTEEELNTSCETYNSEVQEQTMDNKNTMTKNEILNELSEMYNYFKNMEPMLKERQALQTKAKTILNKKILPGSVIVHVVVWYIVGTIVCLPGAIPFVPHLLEKLSASEVGMVIIMIGMFAILIVTTVLTRKIIKNSFLKKYTTAAVLDDLSDKITQVNNQLNEYYNNYKNVTGKECTLDKELVHPNMISKIYRIIEMGRADTLKEAINIAYNEEVILKQEQQYNNTINQLQNEINTLNKENSRLANRARLLYSEYINEKNRR